MVCSVALAQNVEPGRQAGSAGQKQGEPAGQGDTVRGQVPGQAAPGQAAQTQPGQQTIQQGQVGQPQTLQQGQFTQQGQQRQGQGRESRSDQEIATCVYGEASNEIEIAKLAEQRAHNQEVRQFAQQMVKDHSPGAQEMQRLAGNLAAESGQQHAANRGGEGGLDWINVKKQIGQQCLASVKQELSQKHGAEFDECFMGLQIGAHMKVVDELKVLRNYASQDLQQKLDKELQTAQHHLQMAKDIERKLKERPSERVSRKTDGSNK